MALAAFGAGCSRRGVPLEPPAAPPLAAATAKESGALGAATGGVTRAEAPLPETCEPLEMALPELGDDGYPAVAGDIGGAPHALDRFYERLARVVRGRARDHVRIGVFGDSNMTMDYVTGTMRRIVQGLWGDAGHGFVASGRPWSHYRHMDVNVRVSGAFDSYAITTKPTGDGAYGFAGIAASSNVPRATVLVSTAGEGAPIGRTMSRLDVFYLRRPAGGTFRIAVDGSPVKTIETAAETRGYGAFRVELADAAHEIALSVVGRTGTVRLFGTALERERPGVVVDSIGVGAANTLTFTLQAADVMIPMLAHRRYDLVVQMSGGGDLIRWRAAPSHVRRFVEQQRLAVPGVPVLLVSPPPHGPGPTMPRTQAVTSQRAALALETDSAFWDLFGAIGGATSMPELVRQRFMTADHVHFAPLGGAWVGRQLLGALLRDFTRYLGEHPRAGCDLDAPPAEVSPHCAGFPDCSGAVGQAAAPETPAEPAHG